MNKKLYRSRKDKLLAGVCGGISEYFNISSILIRLVCIALFVNNGIGLWVYIIAWIIIPKEPEGYTHNDENISTNENETIFIGLAFIVIGILQILYNFFPEIVHFSSTLIAGIILVFLGIYLIYKEWGEKR